MKFKLAVSMLVVFVFIVGCSAQNAENVVEVEEKIADYFPLIGLERTYIEYGMEGQEEYVTDKTVLEYDEDGNEVIYIHAKGGLVGEAVKQYAVSENEIRLIYIINLLMNIAVDEIVLRNTKKWSTGDADESTSTITGKDLTMETQAGTFENVLEVTNITMSKTKEYKVIQYYAPKVGLIKTVYSTDAEEEFLSSELKETNLAILLGHVSHNDENNIEKEEEPQQQIMDRTGYIDGDLYIDEKYGFRFQLPFAQSENIQADYTMWNGKVHLGFTYRNEEVEQSLFNIVVDEEVIEESDWNNAMDRYLGKNEFYTFSLSVAPEPSESLMRSDDEQILTHIQSIMGNMDIVIDSFEIK